MIDGATRSKNVADDQMCHTDFVIDARQSFGWRNFGIRELMCAATAREQVRGGQANRVKYIGYIARRKTMNEQATGARLANRQRSRFTLVRRAAGTPSMMTNLAHVVEAAQQQISRVRCHVGSQPAAIMATTLTQ